MEISLVGIYKGSQVAVWVEPYPKEHSRKYIHENCPKFTTDPLINTRSEDSRFNFTVPGFEWNQHIIVLRVRHMNCIPIEKILDANDLMDGDVPMVVFIDQTVEFFDDYHPRLRTRTVIGPYGIPFKIPDWL